MSQLSVYDVTPVLEANILADNDVFFVPIEVPQVFEKGVARALQSVIVVDGDDQATEFDLIFFNATATLGTLNAGITISDADAAKIIGSVSFVAADAIDLINSTMFVKTGIGMIMEGVTGSIWVAGVVRSGTPTYTASGFKIKLGFI
jgi:hypothetical protein